MTNKTQLNSFKKMMISSQMNHNITTNNDVITIQRKQMEGKCSETWNLQGFLQDPLANMHGKASLSLFSYIWLVGENTNNLFQKMQLPNNWHLKFLINRKGFLWDWPDLPCGRVAFTTAAWTGGRHFWFIFYFWFILYNYHI